MQPRRGARAAESARLEIVCPARDRGFKSHPLRQVGQVRTPFRDKVAGVLPLTKRSGASWIQANVMDGMWLFTPWARGVLADKGEALAHFVRSVLTGLEGLDGAILSSGAAMAQGEFHGESAPLSSALALRRPLPCGRVRETIIVPLRHEPTNQVSDVLRLYDREPEWLEWGLATAGLPRSKRLSQ
jgi:hypothetical protein